MKLSPALADTWRRLGQYESAHGSPPTMAEMADMRGMASRRAAMYCVHMLVKRGLVEELPRYYRRYRIMSGVTVLRDGTVMRSVPGQS